ncbi:MULTISPECIES: gamma-glutamylcyclotransferase family protein [unclassified Flavobacterium]|uniref:gamma-glutamylcyclotransferase family protein n=1 Tax=unclassified Flavobacterium TaxID=196869 RepID=UPI0004938822|nr:MULTISPECIES: gamma-glutamylcyclotransferase family protein [unclassified Flavobacterium]MBF4493433.1 gamma-glutamylcyclotransferase [Flavobacterium sp. MR2016-29]
MEKLFSYGTLRSKEIQRRVFNKLLTGTPDQLLGYKLKSLQIEEEFGMADYVVVVPSENPSEIIHGVAFSISKADLAKADQFESNSYKRVQVTLNSGTTAWVYIEN